MKEAQRQTQAGRPDLGEKVIRDVIRSDPEFLSARMDLSNPLSLLGRYDEAEELLLSLRPSAAQGFVSRDALDFQLSWHAFRRGRFRDALELRSAGRRLGVWGPPKVNLPFPEWERGHDLNGKKILILGEGGAGDEVLHVRFARTLQSRGARVAWCSRHGLSSVISRVVGIERASDELVMADVWVRVMDLVRLLDLDPSAIPNTPYVTPDGNFLEKWSARVVARGSEARSSPLRVGLRWQGNPHFEDDALRSVPFECLLPFFDIPGVEIHSLQRDSGANAFPPARANALDWSADLETWEDTAALISQLDVVVSSCTAVVHLAAAMGKPTLLLCPLKPYYIWAMPGQGQEWYSSIKIFNQTHSGDWSAPVGMCREEIRRMAETVPARK